MIIDGKRVDCQAFLHAQDGYWHGECIDCGFHVEGLYMDRVNNQLVQHVRRTHVVRQAV